MKILALFTSEYDGYQLYDITNTSKETREFLERLASKRNIDWSDQHMLKEKDPDYIEFNKFYNHVPNLGTTMGVFRNLEEMISIHIYMR